MNEDAKKLRIFSNQISNDVRKDLYLAYEMGIEKGRADMYRELKGKLMDSAFRNAGTMMFPKFEVKEQNVPETNVGEIGAEE